MYTMIRRYTVAPDTVNEVIRRVVEGFIPIVCKSPGFLTYDLVSTGKDTLTSISTFENEVNAQNSNNVAAGWIKENLASFITKPPVISGGKVSVHKTRAM